MQVFVFYAEHMLEMQTNLTFSWLWRLIVHYSSTFWNCTQQTKLKLCARSIWKSDRLIHWKTGRRSGLSFVFLWHFIVAICQSNWWMSWHAKVELRVENLGRELCFDSRWLQNGSVCDPTLKLALLWVSSFFLSLFLGGYGGGGKTLIHDMGREEQVSIKREWMRDEQRWAEV